MSTHENSKNRFTWNSTDIITDNEPINGQPPIWQYLLFIFLLNAQLAFADVHQLLCGKDTSGSTSSCVRLHLASFEGLEGGVINKLGLLNEIKANFGAILHRFCGVAPVEKVVIVDDTSTKVCD